MRDTMDFRSAVIEYIREYGTEGLDGPWTSQTQELYKEFQANGYALNRLWLLTPPNWTCPCCARSKAEIARLNQHKELMGVLVEHHDHSDELIEMILIGKARNHPQIKHGALAKAFMKRGANLIRGYDPVVVCQDCNNADPSAKKLVGAPRYSSFSPSHISSFIRIRHNVGHQIEPAAASDAWQKAERPYKRRIALVEWLAEVALEDEHWLSSESRPHDMESIDRRAQSSIDRIGPFIITSHVDDFVSIASTRIDRAIAERARRWSSRRRLEKHPRRPTDGDVAAVAEISHGKIWRRFPADWVCPSCGREKRDCIMPSAQFPWAFAAQPWAQEGKTIEVCAECKSVAGELAKEAGVEVRNVKPDDVKHVIDHVRPNTSHFPRSDDEIDTIVRAISERVAGQRGAQRR